MARGSHSPLDRRVEDWPSACHIRRLSDDGG